MRFKIKRLDRNKHQDIVSAVGWTNSSELFRYVPNVSLNIFSVSDDMTIWKWGIDGEPVRIEWTNNFRNKKLWKLINQFLQWIGIPLAKALMKFLQLLAQMVPTNSSPKLVELRKVFLKLIPLPLLASNGLMKAHLQLLVKMDKSKLGLAAECFAHQL